MVSSPFESDGDQTAGLGTIWRDSVWHGGTWRGKARAGVHPPAFLSQIIILKARRDLARYGVAEPGGACQGKAKTTHGGKENG